MWPAQATPKKSPTSSAPIVTRTMILERAASLACTALAAASSPSWWLWYPLPLLPLPLLLPPLLPPPTVGRSSAPSAPLSATPDLRRRMPRVTGMVDCCCSWWWWVLPSAAAAAALTAAAGCC